ncbi:MAG TPA: hypothetical protein V6C85_07360 [Allocoleopsis sp.]
MQNRVRFVALALASFVFSFLGSLLTPGGFLNRLSAIALCSLVGFQSNTCLAQLPKASERAVAAVSMPPAETTSNNNDEQKVAGCLFGVCVNAPKIPIPGVPVPGGDLLGQAKAATKGTGCVLTTGGLLASIGLLPPPGKATLAVGLIGYAVGRYGAQALIFKADTHDLIGLMQRDLNDLYNYATDYPAECIK